jgi:phosphoglucomutase
MEGMKVVAKGGQFAERPPGIEATFKIRPEIV